MGKLQNNIAYLIGPIDRAADLGVTWRRDITKFLHSLGIWVIDPTDKPVQDINEDADNVAYRHSLKSEGRYDELTTFMKEIVHVDLRSCDNCNFGIAYLNLDIVMCGTIDEIFHLADDKKPVLTVIEQGKKNMPDWMFARLDHNTFFNNFDELKNYIRLIDSGMIKTNNKWVFYDYTKMMSTPNGSNNTTKS